MAYPTSKHGQEIVNKSLWICTTMTEVVCRNKYKEQLILTPALDGNDQFHASAALYLGPKIDTS